jgi:thiamine-phosphate pyrophosphorylase
VNLRPPVDLGLYLILGPDTTLGRPLRDVALAAVAGGATVVQLRQKGGASRAFVEEARALIAVLRPLGVPVIVNDRADVALAAGADGVHVGQDDMSPEDVRRIVGPQLLVGLSVTNVAQARDVDATVVDYVGVGPVFATTSKSDAAPALGIEGTAQVCRALRLPAVAIGGIDRDNAARVLATGVQGIAVISAVCAAEDPELAAALLAAQLPRAGIGRAR